MQDDVSLNGYKRYLASQAAPLPLTAAEEELRQIKLNEVPMSQDLDVHDIIFCWLKKNNDLDKGLISIRKPVILVQVYDFYE